MRRSQLFAEQAEVKAKKELLEKHVVEEKGTELVSDEAVAVEAKDRIFRPSLHHSTETQMVSQRKTEAKLLPGSSKSYDEDHSRDGAMLCGPLGFGCGVR